MDLSLFTLFLRTVPYPRSALGKGEGEGKRWLKRRKGFKKLCGVLKINFIPKAKFSSSKNGIGILASFMQKWPPQTSGFHTFILEQLSYGVSK